MMYRILRNNKEQGPYNLDELLQLSLRPYDLIWVEGKSASWRYPSEIDTLIPHLDITSPVLVAKQTAPLPSVPALKNIEPIEIISPPIEEELTAQILEQKANAIYQRIQAYNAQCDQEAKNVQTKYARSLEDLRQDYADWLHKKKRRNSGLTLDNKGWMALGAMCTAFIFFILAGRDKDLSTTNGEKYLLQSHSTAEAKMGIGKESQKQISFGMNKRDNKVVTQHSSVDQFIDSVRQVLSKQASFKGKVVIENEEVKPAKTIKKQIDTQTIIIAPTFIDAAQTPVLPKPDAAMNAYYTVHESGDRIKELHITVNNTGNVELKEIAVEIIYFKNKSQVLSTETIYFTNLQPGNAASITKPALKKAITVQFKLSKLSS